MDSITPQINVLDSLGIEIFPIDLQASLKTAAGNKRILEMAVNLLAKVQNTWRPRAVIRWLAVERVTADEVLLKSLDGKDTGTLHLGFAGSFMTCASHGLVGIFTAGDELEKQGATASKENRIMDAYLYDLIGLAVLEKVRQRINLLVEEQAATMNWGIGPFLSPGSVHGWELDDQENLCRFLPLERIGVEKDSNGILKPFKSISFLIGIGPAYTAKKVGTTCEVCTKKENCLMRADVQGKVA